MIYALMPGVFAVIVVLIGYAVVSTELERHRTRTGRDTYAAHRADIRKVYDQDEEPAA